MISILAVPVLALIVGILRPCIKYKYPLMLYRKVKSYVFWNGTFKTISGTYTILVMCVLINTKNVSFMFFMILDNVWVNWWNYQFLVHNTVRNHPRNLPFDCLPLASHKFRSARGNRNGTAAWLNVQWSRFKKRTASNLATGVLLRAQSIYFSFGCVQRPLDCLNHDYGIFCHRLSYYHWPGQAIHRGCASK